MNNRLLLIRVLVTIVLVAPFAEGQWKTATGGRRLAVKSPASYSLYSLLRNRLWAGQDLDVVTETPTGGWLVIGNGFFQVSAGHYLPWSLAQEISRTHGLGLRIDDVAFDKDGDWVLVAGSRVRTGGGIESSCMSRLHTATGAGEEIRSVAFDPDGTGWVIATNSDTYSSLVPGSLNYALHECRKGKRGVLQVRFGGSTGRGWVLTTGRWSVTSDGFDGHPGPSQISSELNWFLRMGYQTDKIATFGDGWVVYASGLLPSPSDDKDRFLSNVGGTDIVTRMAQLNVAGLSIAVIKDKRIDWVRGYGVQKNGEDTVVNTYTRFNAASLSKAVAAMTALSVVEDGLVGLDQGMLNILNDPSNTVDYGDLVGEWAHEHATETINFPFFGPLVFPDDLRISGVSLRMLLSHTAGLNVHGIGLLPMQQNGLPNPAGLRDELIWTPNSRVNNSLTLMPLGTERVMLTQDPATMYDYSGGGFCAAEALIEAATQKDFASAASLRVLGPLGMFRSTFLRNVSATNRANGHTGSGTVLDHRYCPGKAAGGLVTTAEDYARFLCCLALDGRRHADASWSDRVLDWYTTRWIMMRGVNDTNGNRINIDATTYPALGVMASRTSDLGRPLYLEHGGSQSGFANRFRIYPYKGEGVVFFINSSGNSNGRQLRTELLTAFVNIYI